MKRKNELKILSLSNFTKLNGMYSQWIKEYSFVTVLSTRLSCKQFLQNFDCDTSHVFVIDCISSENHKQSICVPSLSALTAMGLAVSTLLKAKKIDLLVIDSLSNLIISNDEVTVLKFANDLSQKARKAGCSLIFPILKKDRIDKLSAVELYVDKIEEL
jgi:hypothetical protein